MKKIVLVAALVLLSGSTVFAAATLLGLTDFRDVIPGSWYEKAVAELRQKNIIEGYDDGTFRPARNVTRAELSVILSTLLEFVPHPTGTEPWKRYVNRKFGFVVHYPPDWRSVKIASHATGFRPPWMAKNSVQWAVIARDAEPSPLEQLIAEMGAGYPDTRSETRESITLNGTNVTRVVVTTSERPSWRHEQIFVPHFNKLYVITNGAIENSDFEIFWRSIKFLAPPEIPKKSKNKEPTKNNSSSIETDIFILGQSQIRL